MCTVPSTHKFADVCKCVLMETAECKQSLEYLRNFLIAFQCVRHTIHSVYYTLSSVCNGPMQLNQLRCVYASYGDIITGHENKPRIHLREGASTSTDSGAETNKALNKTELLYKFQQIQLTTERKCNKNYIFNWKIASNGSNLMEDQSGGSKVALLGQVLVRSSRIIFVPHDTEDIPSALTRYFPLPAAAPTGPQCVCDSYERSWPEATSSASGHIDSQCTCVIPW